MKEKMEIGTILYNHWGYNRTNIDYFIVIEEKPKTIVIEKIGDKTVEVWRTAGTKIPVPDKRTGKVFRVYKRVDERGDSYFAGRLDFYDVQYLYEWDGTPQYFDIFD